MANEEYIFAKAGKDDTKEIESLALHNDGNTKLITAFIQHWYFNNPSHSFSFWKLVAGDKIEGYATTNNFIYVINGKEVHVAMPQNVLISEKLRGKGLFNKLYFKTENHNLQTNKVTAFLTFTNDLSTSIFLNKFSYAKGKCPLVIFKPFSLLSFFKNKNFKRLSSVEEIEDNFFRKAYHFDNAMQKNEAYYKWRYSNYDSNVLHIIAVFNEEAVAGYVFLKEEKKKGIKFLIVMDVIFIDADQFCNIIESGCIYASRRFYSGTMMFDLPLFKIKKGFVFNFKNRFNFLVKGMNAESTKELSKVDFTMFFSDMDIV